MFEQSQGSRTPWTLILGLAVAVAAGLAVWMRPPPEPTTAAPAPAAAPVPAFDGTAVDAAGHVRAAVEELSDVTLWHLDCAALPCLAVVRLSPTTHGARRVRLEQILKDRGWSLSPAGIVHVLEPKPPTHPRRVVYTFALSAAPLGPDARAPVKARMQKLAANADLAVGAW